MIVSWVTVDEPGSNTVLYWSENSKDKKEAEGKLTKYKFSNYTSGYIHHCTIKKLEVNFSYFFNGIPSFVCFVFSFGQDMISEILLWPIWNEIFNFFVVVQHQILLRGWNWSHDTHILVHNTP